MTNPTKAPMGNAIDDVKLLPCPFCGGEGAYQTDTEEEDFSEEWIGCLECGATTALEIWNRRDSPASQHTGWSDEAVEAAARVIAGNVSKAQMEANPEEAGYARDTARAALSAASSIAPATGFEVKADRDSIRFAQQFADMYRSGAQGAAMDFDAAQALALAIDDILASCISPSVSKESGEP